MRLARPVGVAILGIVAACNGTTADGYGGGGGGQPGANQVFMQDIAFNPSTRTVSAGTTVTWVNQDNTQHTVTYSSGPGSSFNSGPLSLGASYSRTFSTAGTYQYYCMFHGSPGAGMHGTVVAQ